MAFLFRSKPPSGVILAVIILISAASGMGMVFWGGSRGLFAFDHSIVFDGAWRIFSGQTPWRDFLVPFGLPAFWLQTFFFRFLGVDYFAYLFGAAALNALAAAAACLSARILFPRRFFPVLIAGMLTAVWFYPPMGVPFLDQTAYFFSFLCILVLLAGAFRFKGSGLLFVLGGLLSWCAILSHPRAGLYILPLYPLLIFFTRTPGSRIRSLASFGGGFVLGAAIFSAWLIVFSQPEDFLAYAVRIPLGEFRSRFRSGFFGPFLGGGRGLVRILTGRSCCDFFFSCYNPEKLGVYLHRIPIVPRLVLLAVFYLGLFKGVLLLIAFRKNPRIDPRSVAVVLLILGLFLFQASYIHHTLNHAAAGIPFVGLILSAGFGLCFRSRFPLGKEGGSKRTLSVWTTRTLAGLVAAGVAAVGMEVTWRRVVHDGLRQAAVFRPLPIASFRPLRWGDPTWLSGVTVTAADIKGLYDYLENEEKNFFIFPELTVLYGLLGKPSPQPLVWFHRGLTYSGNYDFELDRRIVRDLEKNEVKIIVLEGILSPERDRIFDLFPLLKWYIINRFQSEGSIGPFFLFAKRLPESGGW